MSDVPFLVYLTERHVRALTTIAPMVPLTHVGPCSFNPAEGEYEIPYSAARTALRCAIAMGDDDLEARFRAAWVSP